MNRIKCEKCGEVIGHLITTCKCPYCFENSGVDLVEINEGLKAKVNELEVEMKWKEEVAENWFDKCNKAENKVIELESIMTDVKRELQDILENKGM